MYIGVCEHVYNFLDSLSLNRKNPFNYNINIYNICIKITPIIYLNYLYVEKKKIINIITIYNLEMARFEKLILKKFKSIYDLNK